MTNNSRSCPCISGKTYKGCCQPLHNGEMHASTAEQLMYSRYSAFCLGKVAYLIATLHPDKRQQDDEQTLAQTIEQTKWIGLKIIQYQSEGHTATVEFVAFYQDDPFNQLHERSNFIKENNCWFYVDGEFLPDIKLTRNELCFCGSGKKLKKCHAS
ncbi:MAG: YchJ family protein [Gammaproteobacteria bacterium]|nr:YchJ family protein [Gammaproteobacteria bacterium]